MPRASFLGFSVGPDIVVGVWTLAITAHKSITTAHKLGVYPFVLTRVANAVLVTATNFCEIIDARGHVQAVLSHHLLATNNIQRATGTERR